MIYVVAPSRYVVVIAMPLPMAVAQTANVVVLVATVRALKMHGGGPNVSCTATH